jgi:hypothetical protein
VFINLPGLDTIRLDPARKALFGIESVFARAMANPEHVRKLEDVGLAIKVMVGEEYAAYYRDLHAKAAKYTEWALKLR